ncbi:hypothetical protein CCR75_006496 [Bremia lactucae]|uniref:Uncharacterized protein n=1 Tax=Bremia lactucae TaxID=4779 RepID=A0A976IGV3_BRELC|nr:hypothetical protein CCR75_006496 [Bremia lactucae]
MAELPTITALEVYDVLIIAVVIFALDLAMKILSERGAHLSPAERKLLGDYNAQLRLVNRLNSVEMFVEQAKATRKMNALKKEMQQLAEERVAESVSSEFYKRFDRIRTPVLMGIILLYYWNEPLTVLAQGFMLPLERLMAFPGFPLGSISAMGWAGICRRVSARIL